MPTKISYTFPSDPSFPQTKKKQEVGGKRESNSRDPFHWHPAKSKVIICQTLFLSGKISSPTEMLNKFGKSWFHWVNKPQIPLFSSSRDPQGYSLTKMQNNHAKLKVFCDQEQCGKHWPRSAHFTGLQKIAANQPGLLKTTLAPFPLRKAKKWPLALLWIPTVLSQKGLTSVSL